MSELIDGCDGVWGEVVAIDGIINNKGSCRPIRSATRSGASLHLIRTRPAIAHPVSGSCG